MAHAELTNLRTLARWFSSFAVLLAFATYSALSFLGILVTKGELGAARVIFYIGIALLLLSPIAYALNRLDLAEILFGGSLFFTGLAILGYSDLTSALIVSYLMLLLMGIIIGLIGYKRMKGDLNEVFRIRMLLIFSILYIIQIVTYTYEMMDGKMTLSGLFTTYLIMPAPQIFVLGGPLALLFAVLLLIYSILGLLGENVTWYKNAFRVMVLFSILSGMALNLAVLSLVGTIAGYSTLIYGVPTASTGIPHLLNLLAMYWIIIAPSTLIGSVFLLFIIYHVMAEYISKE